MKTRITLSVALVSLLSVSAFAQDATPKALEKYNQTVDARQANQQQRYDNGVANGSLNAREQARLSKRLARSENKQLKANADGQLTRHEVQSTRKTLHKNSHRLYVQKHD